MGQGSKLLKEALAEQRAIKRAVADAHRITSDGGQLHALPISGDPARWAIRRTGSFREEVIGRILTRNKAAVAAALNALEGFQIAGTL